MISSKLLRVMSFPHPPHLKWFSLLVLLTLILELPSPAISAVGRCEERCETNRPYWSTKPYKLDCDKEYDPDEASEISACKSHCKDCPDEICNKNSPIYNCPSKFGASPPISEDCEKRCYRTRGIGPFPAFNFSCKAEYKKDDNLLKKCKNECELCPRDVCNPYDPDTSHCPAGEREPLIGRCKSRCDEGRGESGSTEAYIIKCNDLEFDDEIQECKDDCFSCPNEVCDSTEFKRIFYCPKIPAPLPPPPPPTYEGKCKTRCDDKRPKGQYGVSTKAYTLKCSEKYEHNNWNNNKKIRHCKHHCKKCPSEVCNSKVDDNTYHCPTFQLQRRCDDICIANHEYGSKEEYTLKCSTAYSNKWDIEYCQVICEDCPSTVCDPKVDNNTYNCPEYVPPPAIEPPEHYWEDRGSESRPGEGSPLVAFVILVIFLLLIVASIGVCIYCCVRQKPTTVQPGQYYASPGGFGLGQQPFPGNINAQGYPIGGQQQQPYPMPYSASSQSDGSSTPLPRSVPTAQSDGSSTPVPRSVPTAQLGSANKA